MSAAKQTTTKLEQLKYNMSRDYQSYYDEIPAKTNQSPSDWKWSDKLHVYEKNQQMTYLFVFACNKVFYTL